MTSWQVIASEARLCVGVFDAAIHAFLICPDFAAAWALEETWDCSWPDFIAFSGEKCKKMHLKVVYIAYI
jgi:hypothetical protein